MSGDSGWAKLLFGGIGVAAFTFAANHVWERVSHRPVGPEYVHVAVRSEDGQLLFYVRNESHEPLDLVAADFRVALPEAKQALFGAYPTPSQFYEVEPGADAELAQGDGAMRVHLRIAQAIEPGEVDQFGLTIRSAAGPLAPAAGSIEGVMTDLKGNAYPIRY
jgi:hypothetical protein